MKKNLIDHYRQVNILLFVKKKLKYRSIYNQKLLVLNSGVKQTSYIMKISANEVF